MFYFDEKLQYPVKVEAPDPLFARMLQQAIGGIEGEIRVCMQYFFQAWGARGPTTKYRDMLLHTATEEMGHIEMLATAVAMNLEQAPTSVQEEGAKDKVVGAMNGWRKPATCDRRDASPPCPVDRHGCLSSEFGRRAVRHVAHLRQRQSCRRHVLQRRREIDGSCARRASVQRTLGGHEGTLPIPNSFLQEDEHQKYNYNFFACAHDGEKPEKGRWTNGPSLDGKGKYTVFQNKPLGEEPVLGPARPDSGAETQQIG